ncbi:hypothetical protein DM01DRAFT_1368281 [Hesseltinella vesiculosa]|uniref:Uncharacterized protein n=1 Tax=Hesseltinella vesiculosa TaxID=101127 RepID=A0A1X2G8F2_9FUNG|nr:hypothetical protein DM01DRAFT_1368281 [Hesseltinella vesiculosa]
MKLSLFVSCLLAAVASTNVLVRADSLQDQIDAAQKKFCGGIAVSSPTASQVFADPSKIQVTVTRKPNAQAKIVSAVDVYTIQSGKPKYVGTAWKGNYALNQKATLSVDLSKTKGLKFPGQFEFRVWVHNKAGPDCTLMSKVFRVSSSAHTNDVEQEFSNLDTNVDRGCFGVDLVSPAIGEHKKANEGFNVQIQRDSSSHLENIESLVLYTISLDSRTPQQVQTSWSGNETVHQMVNVKDTIKDASAANNAYFYKLTGSTIYGESCDFYSHPFYVDN